MDTNEIQIMAGKILIGRKLPFFTTNKIRKMADNYLAKLMEANIIAFELISEIKTMGKWEILECENCGSFLKIDKSINSTCNCLYCGWEF